MVWYDILVFIHKQSNDTIHGKDTGAVLRLQYLKHSAAEVARCRDEVHGNLVILVELQPLTVALCSGHHLLPENKRVGKATHQITSRAS